MIRLWHGTGSLEITLEGIARADDDWTRIRSSAIRLLRARKLGLSADLLEKIPFQYWAGTNFFGDEYNLLYAELPLHRYVKIGEMAAQDDVKRAATQVAHTLGELGAHIRFIAVALDTDDGPEPVPPPTLLTASAAVERALDEAEALLRSTGPASAVDRVHTALHGYIRAACERAGLSAADDQSLTSAFKVLRQCHPAFQASGPRGDDVTRICNALATIVDAFNPIRNSASGAHPNEAVLETPEAMLVVNTARTLLHYLDAKLA